MKRGVQTLRLRFFLWSGILGPLVFRAAFVGRDFLHGAKELSTVPSHNSDEILSERTENIAVDNLLTASVRLNRGR